MTRGSQLVPVSTRRLQQVDPASGEHEHSGDARSPALCRTLDAIGTHVRQHGNGPTRRSDHGLE